MDPIRILHIATMNRGGQETFIMNVYRNLERSKIQFDFLMYTLSDCDYDKEILELGGKIYKIPFVNHKYLHNSRIIIKFLKAHPEYKIVHIHTDHSRSIFSILLCKLAGIKRIIIHSHNSKANNKILHYLFRPFLPVFATDFFACSQSAAEWLYGRRIAKSNKVSIINNAIDSRMFIFNKDTRYKVRKELGVENKFVIGHVGRFAPQKNHKFLIDIFCQISRRYPKSVLLLVGGGELENEIKQKVVQLGLNDKVIFLGVRSDIPRLMQAMDVFLFPSLYEGLGIVLIEAQAAGLKCFTSADFVPSEAKVTDLLEYISLTNSPEYWAERVVNAIDYERKDVFKEIARNNYDIKNLVKEIESIYIEMNKNLIRSIPVINKNEL